MTLKLSILQEELQKNGYSIFSTGETDYDMSEIYYYRPENGYEPYPVLLIDQNNKNLLLSGLPPKASFICMDSITAELICSLDSASTIFISPEGFSIWDVLENVKHIFSLYAEWVQLLLTQCLNRVSFDIFLNTIASKLSNPVSVTDQYFNILANSKIQDKIPPGTIWDYMMGETFNVSDYYTRAEQKYISRGMKKSPEHYILFHPNRDPEHLYYSALFFIEEKEAGCIGMVDIYAPITKGQIEIMNIARFHLEQYFQYNSSKKLLAQVSNGFFHDLLAGKRYEPRQLDAELSKLGWSRKGSYIILSVCSTEPAYTEMEQLYLLNRILLKFPKAVITAQEQATSLILHEKEYPFHQSKWRADTDSFFLENSLHGGYSYPFYDLASSRYALTQSLFSAVKAADSDLPSVQYYDVQSQHLIDSLKKQEELLSFCDPRLIKLACSKKESNQQLLPCLKTYLAHGCNIAETARALFLHRNTVIYRIEKLKTLLNTDFEHLKTKELFSLITSCYILEELAAESLLEKIYT